MGNFEQFVTDIKNSLPKSQLITDELLVKAYSVDGSPFEPVAKAVVDIRDPDDLGLVLAAARRNKISLTYRGSGTGVSGQTIAEEVTVRQIGSYWKKIAVLDNGERVRARCGAIGAEINAALKPYNRFMTSDPSSISAASIGGMASTNAAGLGCIVKKNLFHMMTHLHFTLVDGTSVDTADSASVEKFRKYHKPMLDDLLALRTRILNNEAMESTIRRKFAIRNTNGYSLNAFTDYDDPVDILAHLVIGSEGTLAFINSITIKTETLKPYRSTSLVGFYSLDDAIQAVLGLEERCSVYAVEFLNSVSLQALMQLPEFPSFLKGLGNDACALLLETNAETEADLTKNVAQILDVLNSVKLVTEPKFETDHAVCESLWNVRRSLYPLLAGTRAPEEFAYSEDYCVPIKNLPEACREFVRILHQYGFTKSGVHGHALHGNIHFSIPLKINDAEELGRVDKVIKEVAEIVVNLGGALKAEHGTGRAVAPFMLLEWGEDLLQVKKDLKKIIDPDNLMNPGVILNDDPNCHLARLKYAVAVDSYVDTCIDCGFCEYVCPSAHVGLSSRQRIYTQRTIAGMKKNGETEKAAAWEKQFEKLGRDLCAADGLCSTRCPLGIDIAGYMRKLRGEAVSSTGKKVASLIANNFSAVESVASSMLKVGSFAHGIMGHTLAVASSAIPKAVMGMTLPDFNEVHLTGGKKNRSPARKADAPAVVYYPSCAVRMMGYKKTEGIADEGLTDVTLRLLEKAGYNVIIPQNTKGLCCGKSFETKGLMEQADAKLRELEEVLYSASGGGALPVLCDTSPCVGRMRKKMADSVTIFEPVEFTLKFLVERLRFQQRNVKIAIHPTCSTRALGLVDAFKNVAEQCASSVVLPEGIFCCGFSGDKGFTHPELNASALDSLHEQVKDCKEGYSSSRTCEIGLTLHSGKPYRNILSLIDDCTSPL